MLATDTGVATGLVETGLGAGDGNELLQAINRNATTTVRNRLKCFKD
jgi:hypothetical protein